ncbi:MAG TPA: flavin reductase family protein [Terricaulis sp.]|nr:flavin reductase family protein [Terricaulis sp.]
MSSALVLEDPDSIADPALLRRVCATYPTGVAIVTASDGEQRRCGLTINSFISVSLDPPLVLWSLSSRSPNRAFFNSATQGAITILAHDQAELARRFARPHQDKFDGVPLRKAAGDAPVIEGGVAFMRCAPWSVTEAGDHLLHIWEVKAAAVLSPHAPLVFHGGEMRRGFE